MGFSKHLILIALLAAIGISARAASANVVYDENGPIASATHLPIYEWHDDAAPAKAIVVLVHGFTQDGLSPKVLASQLAAQNYLVLSLDLRGHGRWRSDPTAKGRLVDFRLSMKDLTQLCRAAKAAHPDLELFGIGESVGSALIAQVAGRDNSLLNGMILSSPGTRPCVYNIAWVMRDFFASAFRLNHPVNLRKYISKYASPDPRVTKEMLDNPRERNEMTSRELLRTAMFICCTPMRASHISERMPLLVVQGSADHILATDTVTPLLDIIPSLRKQCVVFPQYGHILVGTSFIQPDVVHTIKDWLDSHVGGGELTVTGQIKPSRS
jgi:alpha-beta hydrolase superfamily lysophospholipase